MAGDVFLIICSSFKQNWTSMSPQSFLSSRPYFSTISSAVPRPTLALKSPRINFIFLNCSHRAVTHRIGWRILLICYRGIDLDSYLLVFQPTEVLSFSPNRLLYFLYFTTFFEWTLNQESHSVVMIHVWFFGVWIVEYDLIMMVRSSICPSDFTDFHISTCNLFTSLTALANLQYIDYACSSFPICSSLFFFTMSSRKIFQ